MSGLKLIPVIESLKHLLKYNRTKDIRLQETKAESNWDFDI